ncbi:hypothetical protein H4Q26_010374 [Puccinia striiformis f. sp. tritici PST-130]|nr:hypothetical protein H4Q26_010374 [Puccinia striiformis f. sp. tritici PST-130]
MNQSSTQVLIYSLQAHTYQHTLVDLEEWKEEHLQDVVILTRGQFPLFPAFTEPVLIDSVIYLIYDITHNKLVNELLFNSD